MAAARRAAPQGWGRAGQQADDGRVPAERPAPEHRSGPEHRLAPARSARRPVPSGSAQQREWLRLQRAAGNAATTTLVPARPVAQRAKEVAVSGQAVPVHFAADSDSAVLRTIHVATRVYVFQDAAGWSHVRVLAGPHVGVEGWVRSPHIASRPSGTVESAQELVELFGLLRGAQYATTSGTAPIPFHYPVDGCFARAELMAGLLRDGGYTVDKQFLLSKKGLQVRTPYGGDQEELGGPLQVRWWYHVAPVVEVQDQPLPHPRTRYVLDPSVADGPLTVDLWHSRMTSDQIEEVRYDMLPIMLHVMDGYPVDRQWSVRTGPEVYKPPVAAPWTGTTAAQGQPAQELAVASALEPAHQAVAFLARLFRTVFELWTTDQAVQHAPCPYAGYPADLAHARDLIDRLFPAQRRHIALNFPVFLQDWSYTFFTFAIADDLRDLWARLGTTTYVPAYTGAAGPSRSPGSG